MRTRARATLSPPPAAADDLSATEPLAGTKRAKQEDSQPPPSAQQPPSASSSEEDQDAVLVATPRKAKRVRFSDPGPMEIDEVDVLSSSTGLTPHMRKARLDATPNRRNKPGSRRRRATLPPRLDFSPKPTVVEEMQFTPLRETLSERTRRRLRRNHLSEEMNIIEAEQQELKRLRAREEASDQHIQQLMWELESRRQLGISVDAAEEEQVNQLEAELEDLRHAVAENQACQVADAVAAFEQYASFSDTDMQDVVLETPPSSDRPSPPVDTVDCRPRGDRAALEQAVTRLTKEAYEAKSALETVRGELQQLGFPRSETEPEDILLGLRQSFRTARMELEYVMPGETPDGFEDGRLLLALVKHIGSLSKRLSSSEASRQQHEQSETALRGQFNKCLERSEHVENRLTILEATRIELTSRLKNKQQLLADLEVANEARRAKLKQRQDELDGVKEALAAHEQRRTEMQDEHQTQSKSMEKLKTALTSYREEIAKLETLVTDMDEACTSAQSEAAKHSAQVDALREQKAEAEALLQTKEKLLGDADEKLRAKEEQHAKTRDILASLQADIEKANERASKERKRDSGSFCL